MTRVDVWLARVDENADCQSFEEILSPAERGRAARFVRPIDRVAYVTAHGMLRQALTAAGNRSVPPDAWTFGSEPSGRPFLTGTGARDGVEFSLSHSTTLVGCALTTGAHVGIDLEPMNRDAPLGVGLKYFAPGERAALEAAPEVERRSIFLRYWTLKEAYLKATGLGVTTSRLSKVAFGPDVLRHPEPIFDDELRDDPQHWTFDAWSAGDCHVALAVRAPRSTVQVIRHFMER